MEKILDIVERHSNTRNLLFGIIGSIITIAIMSLATQIMVYEVFGDFTMPDMRFGYTFTDIQMDFNAIGIDGLRVWAVAHSPDFLFPLAYSLSMMFGIMLELRKLELNSKPLRMTILFPLVGGVADYIENTLILSQIIVFPNLSEIVIEIANVVTLLKWAFLILGFVMIFILLILIIIRRFTSRNRDTSIPSSDTD